MCRSWARAICDALPALAGIRYNSRASPALPAVATGSCAMVSTETGPVGTCSAYVVHPSQMSPADLIRFSMPLIVPVLEERIELECP